MTLRVQLIGLPTDINSSHLRGPAKAPAAIRQVMHNGMMNLVAENGVDLSRSDILNDRGDAPLKNDAHDFEIIKSSSIEAFKQGPAVFLGGDHFVTWPIVAGLTQTRGAPVNIVHIDAHPDLYPDFEGNPASHASPFARLFENECIASLTQIGIRTINSVQAAQIEKYNVRAFSPDQVESALSALPGGPTYLSIDIDGIDPAFAPGVSHHEPGGLTVREVINIIHAVPGALIGADIVEHNPDRDINKMTAAVAVKLLKEVVGKIAAT